MNWAKLGSSDFLKAIRPFVGLFVVLLLFAMDSELRSVIFKGGNFKTILTQTVIVAIGAMGMTMVIVSGGIDLSAGSVVALCSVVTARLIEQGHGFVDQEGNNVLKNRSFYLPSLNPFHDGTDGRLNLFYDRYVLVLILFNPFVFQLFVFSSDQIGLQRLLSTSSYKNAERAVYTKMCLSIPMVLLMYFIGMAVFSFYHHEAEVVAPKTGDLALCSGSLLRRCRRLLPACFLPLCSRRS